ncbi:MAG: hypothetical protein SGI77_15225 [Pirellulaceae bacterium]|nr:hypothetical protein [Pirellulaceae bacterium]
MYHPYLDRASLMVLAKLLQQIEELYPQLPPSQLAKLLLLLVQDCSDSIDEFTDSSSIVDRLVPLQLQLHSAQDQEAAVAEELDQLASTHPAEFSPSHVWTLIRAIKVQKQIIDLFRGFDAISTSTIPC